MEPYLIELRMLLLMFCSPAVRIFGKTAPADSSFRSSLFSCKIIIPEFPQKTTARFIFVKMIIYQVVQLIFKYEFQRSVSRAPGGVPGRMLRTGFMKSSKAAGPTVFLEPVRVKAY